jgi:propanol-preferring alcohol dehydrogenase
MFGFGSSAHLAMQVARAWGCEVFVATRGRKHRELALELGAEWAGDTNSPLPVAVDSAIVFAPAGEVVPLAMRSLVPGGTVALAGIYMTPVPEMTYEDCLFHEKTLCSVEANTRQDGRYFLREAAAIKIRSSVEVFPLADANKALLALKEGALLGSAVLRVST